MDDDADLKTLGELAELSGIPERTIRFYIARGLLAGPVKAGRGAAYDASHVKQLARIKKLQAEGRTLVEIGALLTEKKTRLREAAAWWQHELAPDVTVWVKADAAPWRLRQIRAALEQLAAAIDTEQDNNEDI